MHYFKKVHNYAHYGNKLYNILSMSTYLRYVPIVKTCLKRPLKKKTNFKTDYHLMQVKSIAECSEGSILQYFLPSLSFKKLYNIFSMSIYLRYYVPTVKPVLSDHSKKDQ